MWIDSINARRLALRPWGLRSGKPLHWHAPAQTTLNGLSSILILSRQWRGNHQARRKTGKTRTQLAGVSSFIGN